MKKIKITDLINEIGDIECNKESSQYLKCIALYSKHLSESSDPIYVELTVRCDEDNIKPNIYFGLRYNEQRIYALYNLGVEYVYVYHEQYSSIDEMAAREKDDTEFKYNCSHCMNNSEGYCYDLQDGNFKCPDNFHCSLFKKIETTDIMISLFLEGSEAEELSEVRIKTFYDYFERTGDKKKFPFVWSLRQKTLLPISQSTLEALTALKRLGIDNIRVRCI